MGYTEYLKDGFQILKLDRGVISSIAKDKEATKWGLLTVVIASLISALVVGLLFSAVKSTIFPSVAGFSLGIVILSPIFALITLFVGAGILWIVAKIFGGSGTYMGLVRPYSLASMVNILSFIPVISALIAIWLLVVGVVTISETQKLSIGKSIAVVLIPLVILAVLAFVIGGLALFALANAGAFSPA